MKTNKIFLILFFSLTILLVLNLNVYAANACITLDKSTVEIGKPVQITVSGEGVQWNLKLKVDGEVLKTNSEFENYESNKKISFSATYTPTTAGTKNVTLEGSVTEYSDGSTIKSFSPETIKVEPEKTNNPGATENNTGSNNGQTNNSGSSNSGTTNNNSGSTNNGSTNNNSGTSSSGNSGTTTEQPKAKSTNAYLSTLGVRPAEYDFSNFAKTKYEYSVTVPNDVNSLQVLYKAADTKAKVKVTGNSGFEVGSNNEIKIVVTAEDGKATKTYKIKVTKLAFEEEKPGNIIEDEEGVYLTSLELEGLELSPAFAKDTYSYTATLDKDITEIKVNAVANKEKANVEISGNTDLAIGENTINILVKQEDSLAQTVYQITLTKEAINSETPEVQEDNFMDDIVGSVNKYVIVAAGLVLLMIITVIILIILLRKENKRLKDEETEEYDVYQNDENEFENKEVTDEEVKDETNETETKNERRKSRRKEKGRHSK